ncbi:MAG: hypothetical protein ABI706_10135 [Ilumatobacteraceae bacterium]
MQPPTADTSGVGTRANNPSRATAATDHGFTLIEQIISMTVIVGALLGLLSTLGTTARAITTARQRTIAVSLAKQVIENLQGADWTKVATGTGVTTTDPMVAAGTPLKLKVGGSATEDLIFGGTALDGTPVSYRTTQVAVATTFTLRTFVTTVPPAGGNGTGYRHVTVIIEWPSSSPTAHTLQFSSLVFPLDYTSFPSSNGSAEVTDGLITLGGCLGGDTLDDVHVALPGARSDTIASTLRTAIGAATGAAAHVEAHSRIDSTTCTPVDPIAADNCPGVNIANIADNDSSTTTSNTASGSGGTFLCTIPPTAGGLVVSVPPAGAASLTANAKTDLCSPACPLAGVADAVPWALATVTPTAGPSASFVSGDLTGKLWSFVGDWSATTSVDHDAVGSVRATAELRAPALGILSLPGILDGAVKVDAFTANASAASGYTTTAPTLTYGTTVQLWNGIGYATPAVVVAPGTNWTGGSTFAVGDRQVSLVVTVQTQPLLVVSVAATITPSTLGLPPGIGTDTFTIEVNYGRVAAHTTWLTKAA